MPPTALPRPSRLDLLLPGVVLGLLVVYTYGLLVALPYPGFDFTPSTGRVWQVFVDAPPDAALRVGDRLLRVGDTDWAAFRAQPALTLFAGVQPRQVVSLTVERDGRTLTVPWRFAGPNPAEQADRLNSEWFLAYLFWLPGVATALLLRPRDLRRRLLVSFNLLTAVWLSAGAVSRWHLWGSPYVLEAALPLSLAVYLHLHWVFPRPLARLPAFVGWLLYGASAAYAVGQMVRFIPVSSQGTLAGLVLLAVWLLLGLHAAFHRDQRRDVALLFLALLIALAPAIGVGVAGAFGETPAWAGGALLALPVAPLAYLYLSLRRRLGGMELRVNRLITHVVYFVLLASLCVPLLAYADTRVATPGGRLVVSVLVVLGAAGLTAYALGPFHRVFERRVLGVPPAPTHLLETYAARITTRLDAASLAHLIQTELLPSLLVRQSVLWQADGHWPRLATLGVAETDLPTPAQMPALLACDGDRLPLGGVLGPEVVSPWARIVFPLRVEQSVVGLWCLGRRDPDDYYAAGEVATLRLLANELAIALANIGQARQLHALFQADVDQTELERGRLARELHDGALSHLGAITARSEADQIPPAVRLAHDQITAALRATIANLRPALLNYGLAAALRGLADQLEDRPADGPALAVEINATADRHPVPVELHMYRIVQQACENALRHARARALRLTGTLSADRIELTVEDDGRGLAGGGPLDLPDLLARGHYGLVGMFERAALVGATLTLASEPGRGTRLQVVWQPARTEAS